MKLPKDRLALGLLAIAGAVLAASAVTVAATRDFEHPASVDTSQQFSSGSVQRQDTPNDPSYDRAEPDDEDGRTSTNMYEERFDLFGFPSALTPLARYLDPSDMTRFGKPQVSGFNAAGAWKLTLGRPDVVISILDTGIRWEKPELRRQVHLNCAELPAPQGADGKTQAGSSEGCRDAALNYDLDGDGAFTVDDYANDARVDKNGGPQGVADLVDAQDLLRKFSDGKDDDHNGFTDDIAGWDFFNDDNDAYDQSSYFEAGNHGSGRATDAVEEGNEGSGDIGTCPKCQFMPLRVWDTFVADPNNFGMAVVYSADNGVSVIEGADGALGHTAFMEQASEYAYQKGLVQTFSGDDLNTGNHNYPAAYSHVMLIQGTAPDSIGLGTEAPEFAAQLLLNLPVGTQVPTLTYFRGANTTQFGGKSSIAMQGATGSINTGKAAGAAGLVIAAARNAGVQLRPDETRIILEQTAEDVTAPNTIGLLLPDFAQPGWDPHFGWGRADMGKAVSLAASGKVPPEAAIYSPDWYAPLTGETLEVAGLARARFASGGKFHWKLEWGAGHAPTSYETVGEGDSTDAVSAFGSIDLADVREAMASYVQPVDGGAPLFSLTSKHPYDGQFEVKLTVTGEGLDVAGVDRRIFTVLEDETLRPNFPQRLGTGGEAPLRYADLDGDNVPELIVPGEDGVLRVLRKDGSALPGFPVQTQPQFNLTPHLGAPGFAALNVTAAPREILRAVSVADLDGDGYPELITAAGLHIYVWGHDGRPRAGFPVSMDRNNCRGEDQRQEDRHRKCGFLGSPGLGHLEGADKALTIVAAGLDGHLYAFRADGTTLPGFPVNLADPDKGEEATLAESINDPAIGDLNGDGIDDVVIATNETYDAESLNLGSILTGGGVAGAFYDTLGVAAGGSSRVYAVDGKTGAYMPGWPIHLNGAIQDVLPLVGPGHNAALVKIGGTQAIVVSTTGGGLHTYGVDGKLMRSMEQGVFGPLSNATDRLGQMNLFESASIGDLTGLGRPTVVKYGVSLLQVPNLLLVGINAPYNHLIGAYDAQTGVTLPAFPTVTDDYQFLSSSNIGKVVSGTSNQVLTGTGLGLLHAYDGITGQDAAGFPKVTGGWMFAPPELSQDGRIAAITREGYLYEWDVPTAPVCQPEWPTYRHDPHGSGNYDHDGTPPGALREVKVERDGSALKLAWVAPGDDGLCGEGNADHYLVKLDGVAAEGMPAPAAAGTAQTATLAGAGDTGTITLQAVDEAGNASYPVRIVLDEDGGVGGPPVVTPAPARHARFGGAMPALLLLFGLAALRRRA